MPAGFAKIAAPVFVIIGVPSVLRAKRVFGYSFHFSGAVVPSAEPQGHLVPVCFVHGKSAVEFDYFHALIIAQGGFLVKPGVAKYLTMPRLSLYRPNRTNDYRFLDRTISEMYTVGGLDIYLHKYLGPKTNQEDSTQSGNYDATQPNYTFEDPMFIQDLLLLENRDRAYDKNVYTMRGVYNTQDIDFNLSQFGLFLQNDTLYITFHYNDMIDTVGRKLMNGDVLEIPNLRDLNPLDTAIPRALPRYYVIQDTNFASEGFSQTWQPHTWRVKAVPLVNAQEYQEVINKPFMPEQIWDSGNFYPQGTVVNYGDDYYRARIDTPPGVDITNTTNWQLIANPNQIQDSASTRPKDLQINDAILAQAELDVPLSGYDTVKFFIYPTNPDGTPADPSSLTADATDPTVDSSGVQSSDAAQTPRADGWTMGYLTGDGIAPNGLPVTPGVSFPANPQQGQFALRLDYFPNRLFRYDGRKWIKIEDAVRTDLTNGPDNQTLRSRFVNNTYTVPTTDLGNIPSRQSLSELLKPRADNGDDGGNKPPNPRPPGR